MSVASDLAGTTYNGWSNFETWNIALWLQNDEMMYKLTRFAESYDECIESLQYAFGAKTPDGVYWDDTKLNKDELTEMLTEE